MSTLSVPPENGSMAFDEFQRKVSELPRRAPPTTLSPEEQVARAKGVMISKLDSRLAMELETCIHCGMCSEACHFFEATQNPKYTPIHKVHLVRSVYRRELSPLRWFNRLFIRDITAKDLNDWQELLFNSCTECGRCDLMCPLGIQITRGIRIGRQALAAADLMPPELRALDEEQTQKNTLFDVGAEQLREAVKTLANEGIVVPLDRPQADVLLLTTVSDLLLYRQSFAATARILGKLGLDWTIRSDAFEASNFGVLSGNEDSQMLTAKRIMDAARACMVKLVIVPECGHAYPALRFDAPEEFAERPPFEVMAISEFIGREIKAGRLKVKKIGAGKKVTYHDPCKLGRHGGVFKEPRIALEALGVDFREMESHGKTQYCCGGGGGVFMLSGSDELRRRTFDIKMRQVENSGADSVVTSCDTCRMTFVRGSKLVNWDRPVESLVELVAANLAD
ncbi:MAG: (Fe-S)-binding protein [Steroidobacteraceae bacterium]